MAPLIALSGITRWFPLGDGEVTVLKDVTLDIAAGEFVSIVGSSGSGKSTLMNILGCLDGPSAGSYRFDGVEVGGLGIEELATLRREHFGFIFQRYHLMGELSAIDNVAVPAIYAGTSAALREERAVDLLVRLGLGDRLYNRPSQLSGGQQQRVSVARALINGGEVILADEPTGALDSKSGEELLDLLSELHQAGHTVIIVTHDPAVARRAERTIEIRDGEVVRDTRIATASARPGRLASPLPKAGFGASLARLGNAFSIALRSMLAHRMRSFLTMLGIVIGIASVVMVVALGQGGQEQVLSQISALGTNTITVLPGSGFGDRSAGSIRTLTEGDARALAAEPFADSVTPTVNSSGTVLFGNKSASAQVTGVGLNYFQVNGRTIDKGQGFQTDDIDSRAQVAVIDPNAEAELFEAGETALGQVIIVGAVPLRVIGVAAKSTGFGPGGQSLNIWVPYTTAMTRMTGQSALSGITVRVADSADVDTAATQIEAIMLLRHGTKDFFVFNANSIRNAITATTMTLTLLVSAIAVISLVVGGIGVMNIMLVSVTERTREIGVRMAVGARRSDVLTQFLIEAVLVCLVGGAMGVMLALGLGAVVSAFGFQVSYSLASILVALFASSVIGVGFGFFPARRAAGLRPVDALARE
jgi:macrolide transport system ATP-binding/permease protein